MSMLLFLSFFVPGTILILYVSRRSLLSPRSHGFYRFFVFELILVLFLVNVPVWFDDPFSPLHLLSWVLLLGSIGPALAGYLTLRRRGEPSAGEPAGGTRLETNLAFENTGRLITTGIYRHIRHPMYASLLMLCWGIFLKTPSVEGGLLASGATAALLFTARMEERENLARFGNAYRAYIRMTRRFIPFVV